MNPPTALVSFAAELEEDLGHPATLTAIGPRRWRLTVASPRVTVETDYDHISRGRLTYRRSTLSIDGRAVPKASTYTHLRRTFLNPDNPETAVLGEPAWTAVANLAELPAPVRAYRRQLTVALKAKGIDADKHLQYQRAGRRWRILLASDQGEVALHFVQDRHNVSRPHLAREVHQARQFITLTVNGVDRTAEVNNRIDLAIGMWAGVGLPGQPAPGPVARRQGDHLGYGSVDVRRHSVNRQ